MNAPDGFVAHEPITAVHFVADYNSARMMAAYYMECDPHDMHWQTKRRAV